LLLDREVGKEKMVVDDDEVALQGFATHLGDEAVIEVRACLAEAGFAACVELGPEERVLGQIGQLGPSPVFVSFSQLEMWWKCSISSRPSATAGR